MKILRADNVQLLNCGLSYGWGSESALPVSNYGIGLDISTMIGCQSLVSTKAESYALQLGQKARRDLSARDKAVRTGHPEFPCER